MKCRGAVLHQLGAPTPYVESLPLRIEEIELDDPAEGEVLVKVHSASLCHSDLSVVNGVRVRELPMALGHEGSGIVEKVGPGTNLIEGDHVVFVFVASCGECPCCVEHRPALCEKAAFSNSKGTLLNEGMRISLAGKKINHHLGVSCFSEYAVVNAKSLVKVDKDLPLEQGKLFVMFAVI